MCGEKKGGGKKVYMKMGAARRSQSPHFLRRGWRLEQEEEEGKEKACGDYEAASCPLCLVVGGDGPGRDTRAPSA